MYRSAAGYCELNQYERLVHVGLCVSCKNGLGNLRRYSYCVDSVDVTFHREVKKSDTTYMFSAE